MQFFIAEEEGIVAIDGDAWGDAFVGEKKELFYQLKGISLSSRLHDCEDA